MDEDEISNRVNVIALKVYKNFLESLDDEKETLQNLYGDYAGEMFMDWIREYFRNIDF